MDSMENIPFNKTYISGKEEEYIHNVIKNGHLSGDGLYTELCKKWLDEYFAPGISLLTNSCTAALEMTASLLNISHGDEVIMPSFTFVSTANAFIAKGARPVFVDIRRDTLNIDEDLIEESITSKTRAIVVVHYAGVSCEMEKILSIAKKYNLFVIEDAAHAMISSYNGSPLGSIGDFGTVSFHDTKNIIAGEGGALLINNSDFIERAEIIRDKGTNRKKFFRGEIDKYTWVDEGSSHVPSEMISAFLYAQLENAKYITNIRKEIWQEYHFNLEILENKSKIIRPIIPEGANHNGHIYYLLLPDNKIRDKFIIAMKEKGISCAFHYVPLHSSPVGSRIGKFISEPKITEEISERMVRLPIWPTIDSQRVIETTISELS